MRGERGGLQWEVHQVKRLGLLFGLMAVATVLAPAELTGAAPAGNPHLPNLKTLPPSDIHVAYSGGTKYLRFSNVAYNAGDGRLELKPENDRSARKTKVKQRVYTHNALNGWSLAYELDAGTYTFHKGHNHWHFEGFALYELVADNPGVEKRTGTKTTFCIIDTESPATIATYDSSVLSLTHRADAPTYGSCNRDSVTGLSVGWGDKYGYWLDGQSINAAGLPDGWYTLYSKADPTGKIAETNDGDNANSKRFHLQGDLVTF